MVQGMSQESDQRRCVETGGYHMGYMGVEVAPLFFWVDEIMSYIGKQMA